MAPRGGMGYYGRPGPKPGSTFAGGSFSPRRRMVAPTSTNTSPEGAGMPGLPGQRKGWNGAALPPGQMKRMAAGKSLNAHWSPIAQAAGLIPATAAGNPAASPATHMMPDGSTMPGASHMPPGFARRMSPGMGRRTVMPQAAPQPIMPQALPAPYIDPFLEQFPVVY